MPRRAHRDNGQFREQSRYLARRRDPIPERPRHGVLADPPGTEARVSEVTDLVATAIANAESHAELAASRARIVGTADATRRRIERDLHDGAQRLVSVAPKRRAAQAGLANALPLDAPE